MQVDDRKNRINSVAEEIYRYVEKRPNAAETVEGVRTWWIARQRIEESEEVIAAALDYLVEQNKLVKHSRGGRTLYIKAK